MQTSKQAGKTLLELLVVIVIIAILAGLLFSVIGSARERAQRTQCISQMRQLVASLNMYYQDYQDYPYRLSLIYPHYLSDASMLMCPSTPIEGRLELAPNRPPLQRISYIYVKYVVRNRKLLAEMDPNHGLLACFWHGPCDKERLYNEIMSQVVVCGDRFLRARKDGSVQHVTVPMRRFSSRTDGALTEARDGWRIMSDAPCPPSECSDAD
ncbi:MAG: type II secretion system protein [Fimbriimonadales bacterium]